MLAWLRRRSTTATAIPDPVWQAACADIELTAGLAPDQLARLRDDAGRFLHEKRFAASGELDLADGDCLRIAVLACLPVLGLGYDWLRGWSEVIVYPGQFRVRRHSHDEASGVVSESDDWLAGESWQHGPLILSLEDIQADLADPHAGSNLVAHEVAHKLDMLDGHSDGVPPLPDRAAHRRWVEVFEREFRAFRRRVDAGEQTELDPYAAEAPDEFFAVASETYFSAPGLLRQAHPAIHRELRAFYRVELPGPA